MAKRRQNAKDFVQKEDFSFLTSSKKIDEDLTKPESIAMTQSEFTSHGGNKSEL